MTRFWMAAAGLIAMITAPAVALAQIAKSSPVLTTPHFAFYSDLTTNLHDALITAAVARRSKQPELFTAGAGKTCFAGLSAADRDGWLRAVDYYTAGKSTRFQRVMQRLELAGLVQREGLNDSSVRQFLEEATELRDAATSAYRQCRWQPQDGVNRRWIDGVKALLAKYETTLGQELPALFKVAWAGLPFRVDVVETALPVGADSAGPDFPTLHILVSATNSGNQDRAALEIVFHEASHFLTNPDSPLSAAIAAAVKESGFTPQGDLVHQVHFFMTGETVRRVLARAGEPSYTPYLFANKLFSERFRDAVARTWPAYLDGTRTLPDAARDLVRTLAEPGVSSQTTTGPVRPRVIVTTDPELDDSNSLVRYLLYSADLQTEGIIYASSQFHWRGDGKGTLFSVPNREYSRGGLNLCPCASWRWKPGERYIDDAVEIYAKAYPNLKVHDRNYPTPEDLKSKIREGNVEFEADTSKDTPGSTLIKDVLLDDKGGPVYLLAWGGQSTIARALKAIRLQYGSSSQWPAIQEKVSTKAIIQAFGDQDGTNASYIKPEWPGIEFRQMATGTWGYGARGVVRPEFAQYLSAAWTKENVSSVGPFGPFYRVWRDGKQMVPGDVFDYFGQDGTAEELRAKGFQVWTPPQEKGAWISEGDSSTFMNLLDNGLRASENASYGGWGGRNAPDKDAAGASPRDYATARWFEFAQRDFAARLKWSATSTLADANHAPHVSVTSGLNVTAAPGATVRLTATATDPDRNALTIKWWQYADADTYPGAIVFSAADSLTTTFQVPQDATNGQTIHALLQVTDNGTPPLTSFQRVIVTVKMP